MNFLLHHHVALRDLGRPEAAAGAMLPDVWRMADRRAHARHVDGERRAGALVRSVTDGVAHHVSADRWFHDTPVFTRGELAAREALRRARGARKAGLFAHVAWELCLDGALLRRVGTGQVLQAVRASVAAVRPDAHHRAADLLTGLKALDRPRFDVRVDRILDAIALGPWVSGYATASGIVERLDGVRARLGLAAMTGPDRSAVAAALEDLERDADAGLDEILSVRTFSQEGRAARPGS
jgi:hypothetical protein